MPRMMTSIDSLAALMIDPAAAASVSGFVVSALLMTGLTAET